MNTVKAWAKAITALLSVGFIWGVLIVLLLPLHLVAVILDKARGFTDFRDTWNYSVLIAEDVLTNTVFGNYFRTTVSSEVGNLARSGSDTGDKMRDVIDYGFKKGVGQDNHCEASIEPNDKHNLEVKRAIVGFISFVVCLLWFATLCHLLISWLLS